MHDLESPDADPVAILWIHVRELLNEHGDPSPRELDRLAASFDLRLPSSTVQDWLDNGTVPAWERFEVLLRTLNAEKDRKWRRLHDEALTARNLRRREERRRGIAAVRPDAVATTERTPSPEPVARPVVTQAVTQAVVETRTTGGRRRRRVSLAVAACSVACVAAAAVWPTLGREAHPGPVISRRCAYVTREPAGVYPSPSAGPVFVKYKTAGERVEVLDRAHPPGWLVVKTPKDRPGFQYMQESVLSVPGPCPSTVAGAGP
ncbi:hypothetical protein [Microbispora triticiradicis]|uniref:hypothetical protein n=1 Tax=Microbispora triticiradicis TaxID=2200763 RepID=UPI001AD7A67C|nr:hypothetical protein [Microbispora triticiradicis]MBO4271589.1 hypothetical protein [Microbispora triticiradicis]